MKNRCQTVLFVDDEPRVIARIPRSPVQSSQQEESHG
jgi:hypothetical protein